MKQPKEPKETIPGGDFGAFSGEGVTPIAEILGIDHAGSFKDLATADDQPVGGFAKGSEGGREVGALDAPQGAKK